MNQAWIQLLPPILRSKLHGRYTLQKILSNTGWLFADRILRMGVGLIVGVWVARYLGPEQFGLFNYAIAFVALLSPVATMGLDNLVIRDLVHDTANKDEILGTTTALKFVGAVLAWLLIMSGVGLMRSNDRTTQWLVGIIAIGLLFQSFDSIDFWFQSQIQSKFTVFARSTAFILVTGARVALIQVKAPLVAFAWLGCAEALLVSVGLVIVYKIKGWRLSTWRSSFVRAYELLKHSWLLVLSGLAIMTYMKIDQIMLSQIIGNDAVGIYSAALRISEVWYFIPMAVISSVFPTIVAVKTSDIKLYYTRLSNLFNFMARLAYAIAIPITFLSGWLIELLFGSHYAAAAPVLAIHVWANVFVFLGVAQESWNISEGFLKLSLLQTLIGAVINILLNLILIPSYASIGAALATVVAYAFSAVITNIVSQSTRKILLLQLRAMLLIG
jgi:PST family polysaccharide transporter